MLIFVYGRKWGTLSFFLYVDIQLYQHHLLKRISFPHCVTLVKFKFTVYMWDLIVMSLFWYIYLSLCQYHTILITLALKYVLKLEHVMLPILLFFSKKLLAVLGLLWFHMNLRIFKIFLWSIYLGFWWG